MMTRQKIKPLLWLTAPLLLSPTAMLSFTHPTCATTEQQAAPILQAVPIHIPSPLVPVPLFGMWVPELSLATARCGLDPTTPHSLGDTIAIGQIVMQAQSLDTIHTLLRNDPAMIEHISQLKEIHQRMIQRWTGENLLSSEVLP